MDSFFNETLKRTERFLLDKNNSPSLRYRVLKDLFELEDNNKEIISVKRAIYKDEELSSYYANQNDDGSWGDQNNSMSRIMATIWAVRSLSEMGYTAEDEVMIKAKNFLQKHSFIEGGISINGKKEGVLSCYTGIICQALSKAGFIEEATKNVNWILQYQEYKYKDKNYLDEATKEWGDYIRSKYGGCMKKSTCMIGIVRIASALLEYSKYKENKNVEKRINLSRVYLLERELYKREDGTNVIPLGARKNETDKKAKEWLKITYPIAYIPDLVEIIDFVNHSGTYDAGMDSAVDFIKTLQLDNGTWPLQKVAKQKFLFIPEKAAAKKPGLWSTYRVLKALKN